MYLLSRTLYLLLHSRTCLLNYTLTRLLPVNLLAHAHVLYKLYLLERQLGEAVRHLVAALLDLQSLLAECHSLIHSLLDLLAALLDDLLQLLDALLKLGVRLGVGARVRG